LRDEFFAADYYSVSVNTIHRWRLLGIGPRYKKILRSVRYSMDDLVGFLESCPSGGGQEEAR
jgi:hypothetical protein